MKWQKIQIYEQLNLKNKCSEQEGQRQNHGYGVCMNPTRYLLY